MGCMLGAPGAVLACDPLASDILEIRRRFLSGALSRTSSVRAGLAPLLRLHSAVNPAEFSRRPSLGFGKGLRLLP